jgi:hypothetical protein
VRDGRADVDLPEIVVPQPELNGSGDGLPVIDSTWPWIEQSLRLKKDKGYE